MSKLPKKSVRKNNSLGRANKKRQLAFSRLPLLFKKKKKVIRYRDSKGRFISKPKQLPPRDKYGRFKKQTKYQAFGQPLNAFLVARLAIIMIGLIGSVYFGTQMLGASNLEVSQASAPVVSQATPAPEPVGMKRSEPTKLQVPAAGVDTSLITLGKTSEGGLEVPKAYDVAGWYKYSPTPGEVGPAIIAGHVDNYLGAAVFYKLRYLKAGDVISITRADGTVANFKVDGVEQYSQSNFPTDKVYGNLDYPGLRLITCGGKFNYLTRQYEDNTVVFASYVKPI